MRAGEVRGVVGKEEGGGGGGGKQAVKPRSMLAARLSHSLVPRLELC